jgi:pilus assembly protein TadC
VTVTRLAVGAGLLVWVGATLLLSEWARTSRPSLAERLRPFHPGATSARSGSPLSVESLGDIIGPIARAAGDRVAAAFGVSDPLARRLARIHSPEDVTAFRIRQLAVAGTGLLVGAVIAGLAAFRGLPAPAAGLIVVGAPLLAFLVVEQRLARASERWQRHLASEVPVVSEQLAMLLNAGYSLGAALGRLADRGEGCAARDLGVVVNRIRQGLSETDALREWADVAGVDAVERLVGVLSLHTEAADLGRLVSSEARQCRRDLHRRTIESIERRAQQVWVPVTVATLVPGVILLAVPFLSALHMFANA